MTVDYDTALLDPTSAFDAPEAVLAEAGLSRAQKIEILRRWEYDASELAVAEEEGMPQGGDENSLLYRILAALDQIGGRVDVEHSPPTKQGGI